MTLFGGITTTTVVSDGMQFSVLVPWINQWVVCYHGNTVLVLDPFNLKCIGAISIGQQIVDLTTHKDDVYMLVTGHQRTIVKLSFVTMETKKTPVMYIDSSSAMEVFDTVVTDNNDQEENVHIDIIVTDTTIDDTTMITPVIDCDDIVESNDVGMIDQLEAESKEVVSEATNEEQGETGDGNVKTEEDRKEDRGAKKVLSAVESRLHQVTDLKGIILSNPLGKLRLESPKEEEKAKDEPVR